MPTSLQHRSAVPYYVSQLSEKPDGLPVLERVILQSNCTKGIKQPVDIPCIMLFDSSARALVAWLYLSELLFHSEVYVRRHWSRQVCF